MLAYQRVKPLWPACYHHEVRLVCWVMLFLTAASGAWAAEQTDPLARARLLYNQGEYDAALAAAEEGRRTLQRADSADLIAARAYLEKFRDSGSSEDLTNARERLKRINSSQLSGSERVELVIGFGETLYFDGEAGAAGELFDSVLADGLLADDSRERVLDWWASALDEEARRRTPLDRDTLYQRVLIRMRQELGRNAGSITASYWLSAAARGQGDLQAAWDAAQAGWVRSALSTERGATLRDDLDQLMVKAIVPERARLLARPEGDLLFEWEAFKGRWND